MTTEKIREETEKLRALLKLYDDLSKSAGAAFGRETEELHVKLKVAREEMLKATYKVGQLLTEIEEKV